MSSPLKLKLGQKPSDLFIYKKLFNTCFHSMLKAQAFVVIHAYCTWASPSYLPLCHIQQRTRWKWLVCLSVIIFNIIQDGRGVWGCPDRDSTFDVSWWHLSDRMGALVLIWHTTLAIGSDTFSQLHFGNRFYLRAKLSERLVRFKLPVLGDLERRWAPPSFP